MNVKLKTPRAAQSSEVETIGRISSLIEDVLAQRNDDRLLGDVLRETTERLSIPRGHAIRGAIASDFARVAQTAIEADGRISEEEKTHCFPVFYTFANFLATVRDEYQHFEDLQRRNLLPFLLRYKNDDGSFGHRCERTRWIGLDLCRRVARATGDREALDTYVRAQTSMMDDVFSFGGSTPEELREKARLRELIELRRQMIDDSSETGVDPRVTAFCDPKGPPVFSAIARSHQVWERDPFDVETVHAEAREVFARMVDRATSQEGPGSGRMLLIRGESGAGKTHLMRAFRNHLHRERAGLAAYMQMTSRSDDYARYALINVIDGLERPYDSPDLEASGLMMLSTALAEFGGVIPAAALAELREGEFELATDDRVSPLVDTLLEQPPFAGFDPDLLRVILYLQRREPKIRARVLKYLRCERLNPYDSRLLGGIAPLDERGAPQRLLAQLGQLVWRTMGGALVLLVDQLEDITNLDDARGRVPRAIDVMRQLVDDVPSAIVVISCLDDLYTHIQPMLTRSALDRLEKDPPPVILSSTRSSEEIEALVGRRLSFLFDALGVRFREEEPIFPFTRKSLESQHNRRARDVLDWCHQLQLRSVHAGRLVLEGSTEVAPPPVDLETEIIGLEREWNDYRAAFGEDPPDDDAPLLAVLREAVGHVAGEFDPPLRVSATLVGETLHLDEPQRPGLAVGMANRAPQGGWLGRDLKRLEQLAGERTLVLVRRSDYPSNPSTRVVQQLGELVRKGGRKLVCEDGDWRAMLAFARFAAKRGTTAGFDAWRRTERPLGQIRALKELLQLEARDRVAAGSDDHVPAPPQPEPQPDVVPDPPSPPRAVATEGSGSDRIVLGHTAGLVRQPVELPLAELRTHAAFLGSTGSGKTTLALNVIEQALLQRVPVVMVDRKGDLCTYARPSWWITMPDDPAAAARKRALAERVVVDVYTPGAFDGRHLGLSFVPSNLAELKSHERNAAALQSANALGAMAGFNAKSQSHRACATILAKAIELLAALGVGTITLQQLIDMVANPDPALIDSIGHLNTNHFKSLIDALELLRMRNGHLLQADGEVFDAGRLFAAAPDGRTKLSVVSTKFLDGSATVEFWISRMLGELGTWASRNPSATLQAIVMFDEADIYMPAQSKPATKEPMQSLLKRARSAGLGVFLCTQSPGDLDYRSRDNIRTWFLGRIAETTAVNKMRPLLTEARTSVDRRLPKQGIGEFFVLSGGKVTELKADRSLMDTEQLPEEEILALAREHR